MAGARGQPERQIAGRGSDRQCNYAEPLGKATEGRPCLASTVHGLPTPSGRPQLPQSPQVPQTQVGDGQGGGGVLGRGRRRRNLADGGQLAFLPPGEDTPRPEDGGVREKASCSPGRLWRAFSWEALPLLEKTFHCILTQEN